ncbi:MAG: S-adenosylmethionine decarboxylase [bacterium]|nr:S-adenosylmethionine decarboxylase [bacterium]
MKLKNKKNDSFGKELLLDLYRCTPGLAGDLSFNYQVLEDLVVLLKAKKQAPPFIFVSPKEFRDKAGLSGWVPLIESGIQLHTLIRKNFISLDIYTCGVLDQEKVISFCKERYNPKEIKTHFILRGVDYFNI